MQRRTWMIAGGAVLLLGAALAWAFAPRPLEVEVAEVTQGRYTMTIDEDAKTRLRDRYVISAPLAGVLDRIALREGDAVAADEVVATLTPMLSPLLDERTLREQQARVESAQAQVQRAAARIEAARVQLQLANNDARRSAELAHEGFVSPTKLESDRLAALGAQKDLDAAAQDRHIADHEVDVAQAALVAVQRPAAVRAFVLHAPVAGRVLHVLQTSEASVALGTPLIELGDTTRLEVVAELLTGDALHALPGSRVVIDRWGGAVDLDGRVRLVEPGAYTKVSALGVEEQRVKVIIDITSPPERWRALGDAYRVGVHVVTEDVTDALQVPVSAVFPRTDATGMAVLRVDGHHARLTSVDVGGRNATHAWIRSGLLRGQQVIVYPPPAARDGTRVAARVP